ncbi:tyrosine-type recombinase/integrase [Anaerofustis stercorihominis]|uniref:tyrosine-type recombinase/integrase n=1 Tax=Anaerofustis stercorihominis TaxID=214853 RepID=UPI00214C6518|nr:tyrosine-type recombinase/integrase [Anaerofustis stercorihominis]MCR2032773.1 site-specific integrase [Anaerofustis stercorihominis]
MNSFVIEEYLNDLNINENSKKGYLYDLNTFFLFIKERNSYNNSNDLDKELNLFKSINNIDMYAYVNHLKSTLNNSEKTIARKISAVKNLYKYLNKKYSFSSEVVTFKFKYDNTNFNNEVLNDKQIKDLIEYTKSHEPIKNQIIIFLILFNGLTVKELKNIKIKDIYENSILIDNNGENKRIVKINDALRAILSDFLKSVDQLYLLNGRNNKPITERRIQEVVKNALCKIGINKRGISTGILRNTSVKMIKEYNSAGFMDIKNFLGIKTDKQVEKYLKDSKELNELDMNKNPFSKF